MSDRKSAVLTIEVEDIEEDTIVYIDSDKVRSLMQRLCSFVNDAKAKSQPGSAGLPKAQ